MRQYSLRSRPEWNETSSDQVVFLGPLDDDALQREYERCILFVMPSRNEGFGFVFVEARRIGR